MEMQQMYALRTGPVQLPDGEPAELIIEDLGVLHVRSGRLALAYTTLLEMPIVVPIAPGSYSVMRTTAAVDNTYEYSGRRDAYVSVVLSGEPAVSVEPAVIDESTRTAVEDAWIEVEGIDELYGVETLELGAITLTDASEIFRGMPVDPATWYDAVISRSDGTSWFELMDTEEQGPFASVNAELPRGFGGANAITFGARSNQLSPILATRDAEGKITGIHVDLLVLGELSERLGAFEGASQVAYDIAVEDELEELRKESTPENQKRPKRSFFGSLFGR